MCAIILLLPEKYDIIPTGNFKTWSHEVRILEGGKIGIC